MNYERCHHCLTRKHDKLLKHYSLHITSMVFLTLHSEVPSYAVYFKKVIVNDISQSRCVLFKKNDSIGF